MCIFKKVSSKKKWLRFFASDFDSIQSEDIKHVWYFQPILEHVFLFVMRLLASNKVHVSAWAHCDQNNFKV